MIRYLLTSLLLFASNCYSQDRQYGYDMLASMHPAFSTKAAVGIIPSNSIIGILHTTFGNLDKLRIVLDSPNVSGIRIHIVNGSCIRSGKCASYETLEYGYNPTTFNKAVLSNDALIGKFTTRVLSLLPYIQNYPTKKFYISPVLEHNLSNSAFRVLAQIVKDKLPTAIIVNSPEGGNLIERLDGWYTERHGTNAKANPPCFVSPDGNTIEDLDAEKWFKQNPQCINLQWSRVYNGRLADPKWIDPRSRKSFPTINQQKELVRLTTPKNLISKCPPGCGSCRNLGSNWIYKPWSEDKGTGDQRANKPVLISSLKEPSIKLVASNGKEVGALGYYGTYGALYRHYLSWRGGSGGTQLEVAERASKASGSETTWIKSAGKCYGPIHPSFRAGSFR